ncbi:MAG: HAD family hydrolase [Candidatus Hermodarchaeota archaeon]
MIKTVTFDLWNTIFTNRFYSDMRLHLLNHFLEKNGIFLSSDKMKNAFFSTFNISDLNLEETNYRHIYTYERISNLFQVLDIKCSESQIKDIEKSFEEVMLKAPPPLKACVKETLKEISSDFNIGLISNTGITPGRIIKEVFNMYDILKYFQLTLFSDETGVYKPNPLMFKTALDKFECKPQNAIHIGDILETDIRGAKNCKMLTIWINDSSTPRSQNIKPDYEIQKIYDAVEIIKRIK